METDEARLPLLVTPMVAKVNFYYLIERARTRRERFLIVRRRKPEAIILGIDDFLSITGLGQDWVDDARKAAQQT